MPILRAIRALPGVDVGVQTRINEGAKAQGRDEEGKDDAQELEAVLRGLASALEHPAFQSRVTQGLWRGRGGVVAAARITAWLLHLPVVVRGFVLVQACQWLDRGADDDDDEGG